MEMSLKIVVGLIGLLFAGLFVTSTVLLTLALVFRKAEWFLAVAVLMLVIAFGRVVGFVLDGNPTDTTLTAFAFEIVIAAILIFASRKLGISGGAH